MSTICLWRISEGKIVEYWSDADIFGFMQQLGMELKPKEVKK
jgi:predicted ester cyclase